MLLNPYRFAASGGGGATDPYFADVSLLLYGNGTNGGTTFTDLSPSPKTLTPLGDVQTSTAQSISGGSSILFDGVGDMISSPVSAGFEFGTGDFTIELYFRLTSTASDQFLLTYAAPNAVSLADNAFYIAFGSGPPRVAFALLSGVTGYGVSTTTPLVANTWYYVAVTRSGSNLRMFLDGVLEDTNASAGVLINTPVGRDLRIGRYIDTNTAYVNGNMSMIRITKGVARWTASYTPETLPFPAS